MDTLSQSFYMWFMLGNGFLTVGLTILQIILVIYLLRLSKSAQIYMDNNQKQNK